MPSRKAPSENSIWVIPKESNVANKIAKPEGKVLRFLGGSLGMLISFILERYRILLLRYIKSS